MGIMEKSQAGNPEGNLDPLTMTHEEWQANITRGMLLGGTFDWRSQTVFFPRNTLKDISEEACPLTGQMLTYDEVQARHMSVRAASYGMDYHQMLRYRSDREKGIRHVPIPDPSGQ